MTPRASVVIATYQRPDLLRRCVAALLAQSLPRLAYEIVVVHDGPGEATRRMIADFVPSDVAVKYIELPERHGPAAARNAGWRAARAPIIAFTDDDTVPAREWLEAGVAAFEAGIGGVYGAIRMPLRPRPTDYERDAANLADAVFATANCFCRSDLLQRIGGFDERFEMAWREDADLYFRILASGATVRRAPNAVVLHPVRPAGWGVSLGQQRKVLFDALLFKKHPQLYRRHIRPSPRYDYYLIVAALAAAPLLAAAGATVLAVAACTLWLFLTLRFAARRLRGTATTPAHVTEMIVTSALIPPLAVFWRATGALRFKVVFL